jgi:LacI family transcriptional regulator, galactose operon repressor
MSDHQVNSVARRPSISDVASLAGVSKAAVSKVIRDAYGVSPAMRRRVETAIEQLNYRPRAGARALRGSSFTIGVEVPALGNDFFHLVVAGAATRLAESKYRVIVAPGLGYLSGRSVLEALVDQQVDGIIATASTVPTDWLEQLGQHVPIAVLGRHDQSLQYDTVTGDDVAGANLVMDHLFGLGHQQIAHLTLHPPTPRSPHAFRLRVYAQRMQEAGGEPWVIYAETPEDAYEAACALLNERNAPTAIFAGHDELAIAVLRAVTDTGRTRDVSVVGYDNIDLASHPLISLTTVDQFGRDMGMTATELLMERIRDGRRTPRHIQIKPQLRIRDSTRPV